MHRRKEVCLGYYGRGKSWGRSWRSSEGAVIGRSWGFNGFIYGVYTNELSTSQQVALWFSFQTLHGDAKRGVCSGAVRVISCLLPLWGPSVTELSFHQLEARLPGQFYPPAQLASPIPRTVTVVSTGWPPTSAGLHVTVLSEHKTALCCWPRSHLITHSHFSMWPFSFLLL